MAVTFEDACDDQAFAKIGLYGQTGSGKTTLVTSMAIGLHKMLAEHGLPEGKNPVLMADTEIGSHWVWRAFDEAGIKLKVSKTRAFKDLAPMIEMAEDQKSILLIDSLTHFWNELLSSYLTKKGRQQVSVGDWQWIKGRHGNQKFSDAFINSQAHLFWCSRAAQIYKHFVDESGARQMEVVGSKPKAETEAGYEPSMLVLMERHYFPDPKDPSRTKRSITAQVVKDRGPLDGKFFINPAFDNFKPHFDALELGGKHAGVDTSRTSESEIPHDSGDGKIRREQIAVCLDEIKGCLAKHHPRQNADDRKSRLDLMEKYFGTLSWEKVTTLSLEALVAGRNKMWPDMEGTEYEIGNSELPEVKEKLDEIPF